MSYLEETLSKDENVVIELDLTEFIFLKQLIIFIVILTYILRNDFTNDSILTVWYCIVGIVFILFLQKFIKFITTEIALTNKRLLYKEGLLSRNVVELNINQIESIYLNQSIIGRIFNYGTLVITGTGNTDQVIQWLKYPLKLREKIYEIKK